MLPLRRTALTAARVRRTTLPLAPRRYAHDEHAHNDAEHDAHAPSGPVNESFGKAFWITLSFIPAGYLLWTVSRQEDKDSPSVLTRIIAKYTEKWEEAAAINAMHTEMMNQAGKDRVLFHNTRPQEFVDMRFPEIMNVGSPYNVPAGHYANMDKVIAKFQKEAYEDNERKHERLRANKIPSEQPFEIKGPIFRGVQLDTKFK